MTDEIAKRNAPTFSIAAIGETIDIEEYLAMTELPEETEVVHEDMPSTDVDSDAYESTIELEDDEEDDEEEETDEEDEDEDEGE